MDDLVCAIVPGSTMSGWAQDGAPCPCPSCGEMRLRWFEEFAHLADPADYLTTRLPQLISDYRAMQRALAAVRTQVLALEAERNGKRPDLDCDDIRERLFKREEFITTLKESLMDLVDEINVLTDEVDQELDHE